MIRSPSANALPRPALSRWQPLRVGLIELYHYDVEEFWFRDGHLLLRGNNGTGKSKVLSLTLPFLLDANLSSARVEPDGDRHKRMEWNLLMNGRHERRIGYTWIELGRLDDSGHALTLTLGCGLRAIAGRSSVDSWFFITEQRVGADFWLTTPERTALSRERLIEAIGVRGQVFDTAQAYRRSVDERLFRLGTERYAALVDTLIQLRQPQLSKQPNEERLSSALTEALPPLDRGALEDVAEAMSQLEDIRRELQELEAMRKSVAAFGGRYRRYAQIASRRRAKLLRQAQSEFDMASRDLNSSQEELERARIEVTRCQNAEQQSDEQVAADGARLRVLQADPVMRDARRIADERDREAQTRLGEAESRLATAEHAHSRARDALELDATDLNLPSDTEGIERIERALAEYRVTVAELVNGIRSHQTALTELADQLRREYQARDELDAWRSDHGGKHRLLRDAEETVRTLNATVGKKVDELLREIDATKSMQREHEDALKRSRAELIVASSNRGTAEQKCSGARARLEERSQSRKQSIDGLQAFAADTGLLNVALPGIEMPATEIAWGIEVALTLARRAEQSLAEVSAEDSDWHRVQQEISRELTELQSSMSAQGHAVTAEVSDYGLVIRIVYRQRPERPDTMQAHLDADLAERRLILSAQEREVLENHLEKEIAANLQHMIRETEQRVASINAELHARPTSTGVRYRLDWQVLPEDAPDSAPGLAEARKRLLKTSADAWSADDRRQVGEFVQARVTAERTRDDQSTLFDSLARALDYRRWHRFRVQRLQDGAWKPLSGPASSGERALGLTVPLFAAASSHYESAGPHAPRLVLLDEAFAGIDDEARANCMALIREFDLDFVMTSEREWGCYPELPGLSICQLARREGMDAVHVSRWSWDGRMRRAEDDAVQRFPEAVTALPDATIPDVTTIFSAPNPADGER